MDTSSDRFPFSFWLDLIALYTNIIHIPALQISEVLPNQVEENFGYLNLDSISFDKEAQQNQ